MTFSDLHYNTVFMNFICIVALIKNLQGTQHSQRPNPIQPKMPTPAVNSEK